MLVYGSAKGKKQIEIVDATTPAKAREQSCITAVFLIFWDDNAERMAYSYHGASKADIDRMASDAKSLLAEQSPSKPTTANDKLNRVIDEVYEQAEHSAHLALVHPRSKTQFKRGRDFIMTHFLELCDMAYITNMRNLAYFIGRLRKEYRHQAEGSNFADGCMYQLESLAMIANSI